MRRKGELPELLAPAGSFEALVAAVDAGADAVYFGGGAFHARALAKNFDREEMKQALLYCHLHGVRAHITLNTLLFDRELPRALEYARFLWENGADAVISADMGLIDLLHRELPDLEIHASTQAGVHNTAGAAAFAKLGVRRVVAARELCFADICRLTDQAPTEVEIFLHGALCVCRSGQCLFSSMVGGRSGNRGLCAQPCRLPYDGERYPLSLRDLSLAPYIPQIIDCGVSSLKIEGRMKSPAYVSGVTRLYRRLLDERRAATGEEIEALKRIFCRGDGFSDGYFRGDTTRAMTGVRTQTQKQTTRELTAPDTTPKKAPCRAEVALRVGVPAQMTLFCRDKTYTAMGECPQPARSAPLMEAEVIGRLCRMGDTCFSLDGGDVRLALDAGVFMPAGQLNALRRAATEGLADLFRQKVTDTEDVSEKPGGRQTPAEPAALEKDAQNEDDRVELADPATEARASAQATAAPQPFADAKPGDAPLPGKETVPLPEETDVWGVFRRPEVYFGLSDAERGWFSHCFLPLEKWQAARDRCGGVRLPDGVQMPPVVFDSQWPEVRRMLSAAAADGAKFALVAGVDQVPEVRAAGLCPLGDFRLNVTNAGSRAAAASLGVTDVLLSPELTLPQARDVGGRVWLYGRVPLMLLERCIMRERDGCARCESRPLRDRTGAEFPILRVYPHRNELFNALPTYMGDKADALQAAGLHRFVMLFSTETAQEAEGVIAAARAGRSLACAVRRFPSEKIK